MSDPILAGIQDLPDLYLAKGASFKMTVDMDAGYSMSGKFVTFSIRSQAGINGSKRRIFRTDSDESTISISSQVTTIEIVPETESVPAVAAGWTLADVQAAGATQYWLDFAVDEGDAPDIRLQGRAFWIGEGDELPSGVSIVSAPNLEVSIADDEISVSVAVSGGGIETLDTNTPTSGLTGILKAASNTLDVAVAGTDYLTPTGDGSGLTGIVTTPADGSITNAKLANMAEATLKGRAASTGTGAPVDLTASQARAILNVADGATAFDPSAPGPIGDVTPDAGYFTTLSASTSLTLGTSGTLIGGTNLIEQRNGANAQTLNLYNTYTDPTTYERGFFKFASNALRIGTEKGSIGGAARALELQTDGITRLTISTSGSITTTGSLTVGNGNDIMLSSSAQLSWGNGFGRVQYFSGFMYLSADSGQGVKFRSNGANDRLTITNAGAFQFWDGATFEVGTTTGTKFGTSTSQKIGFWNAAPVVQQVLATGAGATADDIITMLQTLGLCKQS